MAEKLRGRLGLFLIILAGIAGIAALANFACPPQPGPYVEAEDVVVEGKGAHIVLQSTDTTNLYSGTVSPDLRTALTGSFPSLKLWDVPSGHLLRTLTDRAELDHPVAFSPDGQSVLTTDKRNRKSVLWDVASGRVLWTLRENLADPVGFSPDGRRLLSGDRQGTVTLRDAGTGQTIRSFKGNSESVTAVAFDADGRSVLSAAGSEVRRWDISSGAELDVFKGESGSIEDIALLRKGYSALSIPSQKNDRTVKVWNVKTGQELAAFTSSESDRGHLFALSPDGGTVLSANGCCVDRFDVAGGGKAGSFTGDFGSIYQLSFSSSAQVPSSDKVSSSVPVLVSSGVTVLRGKGQNGSDYRGSGGRVDIWDVTAERRLASFARQIQGVNSLTFSPDGHVAVSGHFGGAVNLWDMRFGRRLRTFRADFKEPDGLMSVDMDGGRKCDTSSSDELRRPCTTAAVPSPDNRGVLSAGNDKTVNFWNAENAGANWRQGENAGQVQVLAFSPDGRMAVSGGEDGIIRLRDSASGQEIRSVSVHFSPISALAVLPDGARVLSASDDGRLRLWDVTSGRVISNFTGYSSRGRVYSRAVTAIAVSPDGTSALLGSSDGTVSLWDLRIEGELRTFTGHSGADVIAVAFSPDGHTALSAGGDGTVKAWDIAGARTFWGRMWWAVRGRGELRTLSGYGGDRRPNVLRSWQGRLAFSPDGHTMLTGSSDGSLRLWDHVTGKVLATLLFSPDGSWVTMTPEGFYDSSSPEKVQEFAVVRGRDVCSDRNVHDALFRPDLVSEKIAGDKEGKVRAAAAELNLDKACFDPRQ